MITAEKCRKCKCNVCTLLVYSGIVETKSVVFLGAIIVERFFLMLSHFPVYEV